MYKFIVVLLLFSGILFITYEVTKTAKCQNNAPKIEYRYIPRTFEEEQNEPVYVSDIFETMFSQPSPWIMSVRNYDQRKQEQVNAYFISQI